VSKHTPGPWTAILDRDRDDGSEDTWYVLTEKEAAIAVGLYGPDARLIAAAPDLLAALKVALYHLDNPKTGYVADVLRAAIAKAEGAS
jgi:hypothetical protein